MRNTSAHSKLVNLPNIGTCNNLPSGTTSIELLFKSSHMWRLKENIMPIAKTIVNNWSSIKIRIYLSPWNELLDSIFFIFSWGVIKCTYSFINIEVHNFGSNDNSKILFIIGYNHSRWHCSIVQPYLEQYI